VVIVAQWVIAVTAAPLNLLIGIDEGFNSVGIALWAALSNLIPFAIIGGLALYWAWRLDGRTLTDLGLSWRAWFGAFGWAFVALIAALPLVSMLYGISPDQVDQTLGALAVLAPTTLVQAGAEEVLFRGVLLACLVARYGPLRGLLISAALFALWHLYVGQPTIDLIVRAISTFVFGLTAGVVALRQGHLGGVIALHTIWNIADSVVGGFEMNAQDFWQGYLLHTYSGWELSDLTNQSSINSLLLPLLIETALIALICKSTILEIIAKRNGSLSSAQES
jgi:membrane protease YdiL (CAAX protease family)